jgi:hypothetical protein
MCDLIMQLKFLRTKEGQSDESPSSIKVEKIVWICPSAYLSTVTWRRISTKTEGRVEVQLKAFLPWALDGGEWSASCPGRFVTEERAADSQWIGAWVGHRASLDPRANRENPIIAPAGNRNPVVQPVSQSLYWLSYSGSQGIVTEK